MTRENAKKLLSIITAYAEAKPIEYHSFDNGTGVWKWIDIAEEGCTADFSADPERYRIKATPREFFRIELKGGGLLSANFHSLHEAQGYAMNCCPEYQRVVKFVETPII